MEFSPLLWAFHLLKTHHTLVSVSFFEMPPNNKGKNMSSDMPSKYTKRTPLFTNIRCLPNIIIIFYKCFTNNGVEGKWVACKYLLVPFSPTICIVCVTFRKKNRQHSCQVQIIEELNHFQPIYTSIIKKCGRKSIPHKIWKGVVEFF